MHQHTVPMVWGEGLVGIEDGGVRVAYAEYSRGLGGVC
jgi:hypothetical protein